MFYDIHLIAEMKNPQELDNEKKKTLKIVKKAIEGFSRFQNLQ